MWNEGPKGFLLCAEFSANYMIFIEKFLKLMTLSLGEARKQIAALEDINYAQLFSWLVNLAVSRKIIRLKVAERGE